MRLINKDDILLSILFDYEHYILILKPIKCCNKHYYLEYPIIYYDQSSIDIEDEDIMKVFKICNSLEDCIVWLQDYLKPYDEDEKKDNYQYYHIDYIDDSIKPLLKNIFWM